jgi:hypothetical protein
MTLSDIVDGAFKLFKANFRTIVIVTAVFLVPVDLVAAFLGRHATINFGAFSGRTTTASDAGVALPVGYWLLTAADYFLIRPLVAGAVSMVVAESYLGRQTEPEQALDVARRRFPALVVASFVTHLVAVIGFAFCIVPGVILVGLFAGVTPAIVVEGLGPFRGIRRSGRLFRPRFFRTAGIVLLAWLMAGVLANVLGGIPSLVAAAIGPGGWPLRAAGTIVASLLAAPFIAIVSTLLYFDGRIRQEGFDLQLMAEDLSRRHPRS